MFIFLLIENLKFGHSLPIILRVQVLFFFLFFIIFLDDIWEIQNYAAAQLLRIPPSTALGLPWRSSG